MPIATGNDRAEALLVLGSKRSEEPYAQEDRELLAAIAASLALALERPAGAPAPRSDIFEECPECGSCYDSGAAACGPDGARLVPVLLPRVIEGRYRLERRLGRGGMGTVYAAADLSLERRVAVKVIRDDLVGSAEAAERFRREARAAASFAHPNVVTIHDFGVAAATRAFLVMELLEGNTLREALRRGTLLTTGRALSILRNVASALDAAHRRQLVHRDLKPENFFLVGGAAGDSAKVLDFGLAKFLAAAPEHATADTAPGARLGTLRYMSPEQWRGEEAQPSWDLWALAVVAHEMVIGAHPFADRAPIGVAPVFTLSSARLADAPEPIRAFFTRALASDLSARPQSVGALVTDFEWAVGGSEDTTLFLGR